MCIAANGIDFIRVFSSCSDFTASGGKPLRGVDKHNKIHKRTFNR